MANRYPIVFVHGLLGWGRNKMAGLPYFGLAEFEMTRRGLFPSVGPLSSNHDRACELFYRLKGGDVHYGAVHAETFGHAETVPSVDAPLFPEWSSNHPAHFLGQAQGASTVRLLQHLLGLGDFFRDSAGNAYPTNADWISSITSLSGIHNGTPVAYIAGCSPDDGKIARHSTAEFMIQTLLEFDGERGVVADALHRYFYSLDLDQWADKQAFLTGKDNAIYDLSIHGAQDLDFVEDQACSYYFSYVTALDWRSKDMDILFRYPAAELARFDGPLRNLRYPIPDFTAWRESDGLAPVITQDYPLWGTPRVPAPAPADRAFQKGVWYRMGRLQMDHMSPVALPHLSADFGQQRELLRFYGDIYQLLSGL